MAEALARASLERRGWSHVTVSSAGVATGGGSPASPEAVRALARRGIDLAPHGSRAVTEELLQASDVILAMTPSHLQRVEAMGGGDKAELLTRFASGDDASAPAPPVTDPFGGDQAMYDDTCALLEELVEATLDRLAPVVAP